MSQLDSCPCGSQKKFSSCCELYIEQLRPAITSESLMRSRYTAFFLKNMDHIVRTTHPKSRGGFDRKAHQEWADSSEFYKLEILKASQVGDTGMVEFKAYSRVAGEEKLHHEISSFRRDKGLWFFLSGRVVES
jgi:SEC-C motif-containing protein